jgi:cell wall-associated NlpC family hydrolase
MQWSRLRRDEFVAAARELIGVPWVHMGRGKLGVDCVGLILYSGKRVGLYAEDYVVPAYSQAPNRAKMLKHLQRIAIRSMSREYGNIVVFIRQDLAHVGIITDHGNMIHADQAFKKVQEVPFSKPWIDYPHSYWELKDG